VQKKDLPTSSFLSQQQQVSTKKAEVGQDIFESNQTPNNSNYELSKVSTLSK